MEDIQLKYPNFYGNLNSFLTSYSSNEVDVASPDQSRHHRGSSKNATLSFISLSQKKNSFTTLPPSAATNVAKDVVTSKPPIAESSAKKLEASRQFKVCFFPYSKDSPGYQISRFCSFIHHPHFRPAIEFY
jgi:hypothetical protein